MIRKIKHWWKFFTGIEREFNAFRKLTFERLQELQTEIEWLTAENQKREEDNERLRLAIGSLQNELSVISKVQKGEIKV